MGGLTVEETEISLCERPSIPHSPFIDIRSSVSLRCEGTLLFFYSLTMMLIKPSLSNFEFQILRHHFRLRQTVDRMGLKRRVRNYEGDFASVPAAQSFVYSRSMASILATLRRWRSSVSSVESHASTISRISSLVIILPPSVSAFAPLCSRLLRAVAES